MHPQSLLWVHVKGQCGRHRDSGSGAAGHVLESNGKGCKLLSSVMAACLFLQKPHHIWQLYGLSQ